MSARGVLTTAVKMQIVQTPLEASRASAGRATPEMASDVKVRCSSAVWQLQFITDIYLYNRDRSKLSRRV